MPLPPLALLALAGAGLALLAASSGPSPPPAPPSPGDGPPPGLTPAELAVWQGLEPSTRRFVAQVLAQARAAGLAPRLTSGRRTCAQQNALYAQGRDGDTRPVVTYARGCRSWHVQGRAVDCLLPKGATAAQYRQLGEIAKGLGGKWGGDFPGFPDIGHLEYHPGLTIEQVCPNPDDCP